MQLSTRAIGPLSGSAIDQLPREITPFEDAWLLEVEQARPTAVEQNSWAIWWDGAGPTFEDVRNAHATDRQAMLDDAWLDRLAKTHPEGTFDADGAAFQDIVISEVASDYTASRPAVALWHKALGLAPQGGGIKACTTWATTFASLAQAYADGGATADQGALLDVIIAARPCASGADVDKLSAHLADGLAAAGNDAHGNPLASDAIPTACAQQ